MYCEHWASLGAWESRHPSTCHWGEWGCWRRYPTNHARIANASQKITPFISYDLSPLECSMNWCRTNCMVVPHGHVSRVGHSRALDQLPIPNNAGFIRDAPMCYCYSWNLGLCPPNLDGQPALLVWTLCIQIESGRQHVDVKPSLVWDFDPSMEVDNKRYASWLVDGTMLQYRWLIFIIVGWSRVNG